MAVKNITVAGASYSNVPSVNLPITGGGTASFVEISDTTAVASDVKTGKYFFTASGQRVEGTLSGDTPAISVVDTSDSHGGTVRTITALNISDTTAVASDVAQGKYFYTSDGTKTAGTASGGGGGATQHTIHLEFTDSTDTDIEVDYDDALIATMLTAYGPGTWMYNNKQVLEAQLDGLTFYEAMIIPLNTQLVDYTTCTHGYVIDDHADLVAQEWSYVTDYIAIHPDMTFSYKAYLWFYIGFYDESHNPLSVIYVFTDGTQDPDYPNTGSGTLSGTKIPAGAKYVRLCGEAAESSFISLIRTA